MQKADGRHLRKDVEKSAFCLGLFPPEQHLSKDLRAKTLFGKYRKCHREWGGKARKGIC